MSQYIGLQHTFQDAATATADGTALSCGGLAGVDVRIDGITTATITFEGSEDGTGYPTINAVNANTGAVVTTATADGRFIVNTRGLLLVRCRISAYTSGTITVTGKGYGEPDAGLVLASVVSVEPGTAANSLGKAEDAAHASGDVGVMALAVRKDAAAAVGADGDYAPLEVDAYGRAWVSDAWRVSNTSDVTTNDSDKSFTVPAATEWQILMIRVNYASTATAGDRQLEVVIEHPAGTTTATLARAGAVQAASLTYEYLFAPGLADLTAVRDSTYLTTPIPSGTILYAADVLRIYDNNAVAATADDMLVYIQYGFRSV